MKALGFGNVFKSIDMRSHVRFWIGFVFVVFGGNIIPREGFFLFIGQVLALCILLFGVWMIYDVVVKDRRREPDCASRGLETNGG